MSTKLVILGLLKDRPLYGYELKHIIEEHMGDWTNIAFGSIYFALKKLTEENLVEEVETEKEGGRPSRRVYAITEEGRKEFDNLLEDLWTENSRIYYSLDIALFFLKDLPLEKRLPLIQGRLIHSEKSLEHLNHHASQIEGKQDVPPVAEAIFSHTRYHLEAELKWLKELEQNASEGKYE